jgi:hypothetical protein
LLRPRRGRDRDPLRTVPLSVNTDPIGDGRFSLYLQRKQMETTQARQLAKIMLEVGADNPTEESPSSATAAGDTSKLRGIPAIGRGVAGAIGGTDPLREVLKAERDRF